MSPYAQGWREWRERYADLMIGKRNWQITAGGLLLATIILAAGMVWLSNRTSYIVYAVEVDKLGYALTQAQPLTASSPLDGIDRIERYELASLIHQARPVSSDPQVEQQALNSLLAHTGGAADHFLDEYYHSDSAAHNAFQIAQKQTVTVQIDSILKISPKSYEVRWAEVRAI
jgi:type IV secretory pathway TrbF-like protein